MRLLTTFIPGVHARTREAVPAPAERPDLRAALRQAQAAAAGTAQAAQDAAAVAARAQVAVDAARTAVARHDGVDAQVAQHHAGLLRAGDAAGRAALPPNLVEARRAQAAVRQNLADAAAAHTLLAGEARETATSAERAEAELRRAADAVAQEEAGRLVVELREHEREAGRLRSLVGAFLGSRSSVDPPVSWAIQQLVHDGHHGAIADLARSEGAGAARLWQNYRAALAKDADAVLPVPGAAA